MFNINLFLFKNHRLQASAAVLAFLAMVASSASLAGVDVNRANTQELQQVRGIGAKTAQRIVIERARGPFESLEHLSERLSGIGPKTIVKLKDAGLCAGSPDAPCAKAQAVSQLTQRVGASEPRGHQVATPEILHMP